MNSKRIVVGISGGVDSSVAALLLTQAGYDVHALHMSNWDDDEDGYCTAAADLQDARQVCLILDIPFHHVNFAAQYKEQVFAHFLSEYKAGRTPNPDVLCNREIKFGVFRDYAIRLGAERIATGHYARTGNENGAATLRLSADTAKDQTYFLHAIRQEALRASVFPLGDLQKGEVRQIATRYGLPTRDKKDSTGICFIGERPFREFLSRYLPSQPGPMLSADGTELGHHSGAMYYTIGQRKGLGIGGRANAGDLPWYVAGRDVASNTLTVVQGESHPLLWNSELSAIEPHWINGQRPAALTGDPAGNPTGFSCRARIRHRQTPQPCRIRRDDNGRIVVTFEQPQWAIAPGQYVVFYDGDVCRGGATIEATIGAAGQSESRLAS